MQFIIGFLFIRACLLELHRNAAALRCKLEGIAQQVQQDPVQPVLVADHRFIGHIGSHRKIQVLGLHLGHEQVPDLVHGLHQVGPLRLQFHLAAFDAPHVQHVVDQGQQVMAGSFDLIHVIRDLGRVFFFFGQRRIAHDGVHGRADIVAHIGKERTLGLAAHFRQQLLFFCHLLAAQYDLVNQRYNSQHDQNQNQLDHRVFQQYAMNLVHLVFQEEGGRNGFIYCTENMVLLHQQFVIVADPRYGLYRHGLEGLMYPYHGSNDDQGRHPHPAGGGFAKTPAAVFLQQIQEEQAAQDTPDNKDHIGFNLQPGRYVLNRQEQVQREKNGADTSQKAGGFHQPVPFFLCQPERRIGSEPIHHDGPYGGHVHDPADGCPAQERHDDGHRHDKQDGIAGRPVLIQFPKPVRQHFVPGHSI